MESIHENDQELPLSEGVQALADMANQQPAENANDSQIAKMCYNEFANDSQIGEK